jgi:hypothetical protein
MTTTTFETYGLGGFDPTKPNNNIVDEVEVDDPAPVEDLATASQIDELYGLCDCYAYQACETSDWHETEAYAIMQYLKQRAIRNLPGYDDAKGDI